MMSDKVAFEETVKDAGYIYTLVLATMSTLKEARFIAHIVRTIVLSTYPPSSLTGVGISPTPESHIVEGSVQWKTFPLYSRDCFHSLDSLGFLVPGDSKGVNASL